MENPSNIIAQIWQPLQVKKDGTSVQIGCFGRTYHMDGTLPGKIVSNGNEVLTSPIRLRAAFHGKEESVRNENTYIEEQNDDRLVYLNQATVGNVIINSRVTVERDGLIWIDLMLFPFTGTGAMFGDIDSLTPKLDRLTLELPISRNCGELFHYWPAVSASLSSNGTLSNSGSIPENGLSLPFRPHLWIGNESAGLSFYAESNQFWQNSDQAKALTVSLTDSATVVQIHLLDSMPVDWVGRSGDDWNDAIEPIGFSFGLQASPVKPYTPVGDYRKVCHKNLACADPDHPYDLDSFEREADEFASLGIRWRTFHEDWSIIQNYGRPQDEALFKAKIDALHKRGIKAMVYFGYEYASALPDFYDNYRNAVVRGENGTLRGGWQRRPPQRDYIVCYAGNYAETMLERCRHAMDEYGADGIYTDGTYVPIGCANEKHGCGWTDRDGNRHQTWPLRKVREHVKKLYTQTHERGGIVEAHQSSCVIPMILAYSDCYWDGEHIALTYDPVTQAARVLSGKELIEKYTGENGSGVGAIRAEFTGINFGVPCQFLSYAPVFDECSGLTLLYGVLPKPQGGMDNLRQAARHWKIMDDYGLNEDCFIPFWKKDCPIKCSERSVSCSVWSTERGFIAVFVNLSGTPVQTDFSCTLPHSSAVEIDSGTVLTENHIQINDSAPVYVFFEK